MSVSPLSLAATEYRNRAILAGVVLVGITLLLYWPVQQFDFVAFDDTAYVTENRIVREGLTAGGIRWAFAAFEVANWHPLTWLSHMLDAEIYGLMPAATTGRACRFTQTGQCPRPKNSWRKGKSF